MGCWLVSLRRARLRAKSAFPALSGGVLTGEGDGGGDGEREEGAYRT